MRKLQLSVDDLQVESFATGDQGLFQGTVRTNQDESAGCEYTPNASCPQTCPPEATCYVSACTCEQTHCGDHTCKSTCPPEFTCSYPPCSPAATMDQTCGFTEAGCC